MALFEKYALNTRFLLYEPGPPVVEPCERNKRDEHDDAENLGNGFDHLPRRCFLVGRSYERGFFREQGGGSGFGWAGSLGGRRSFRRHDGWSDCSRHGRYALWSGRNLRLNGWGGD